MRETARFLILLILTGGFASGQTFKVLYSFGTNSYDDGQYPMSTLVLDPDGNLYGTTRQGGYYSSGAIFELSPTADGGWQESVIHGMCDDDETCYDGVFPEAGLLRDAQGNLFGTVDYGGYECEIGTSCGVLFELSPPQQDGGTWSYVSLYDFSGPPNGIHPTDALAMDEVGNLYGTTSGGGIGHAVGKDSFVQGGTVFELSKGSNGWTIHTLYSFCSLGQQNICPDGIDPNGGVTFDKFGNLYGTTYSGGSDSWGGGGTVFKLSPDSGAWKESIIAASGNGYPLATPRLDSDGNLYGTYSGGGGLRGPDNHGGVFELSAQSGYQKQRNFKFDIADGAVPYGEILIDSQSHRLYGTTLGCCSSPNGNVFKLMLQESRRCYTPFVSKRIAWMEVSLILDLSKTKLATYSERRGTVVHLDTVSFSRSLHRCKI